VLDSQNHVNLRCALAASVGGTFGHASLVDGLVVHYSHAGRIAKCWSLQPDEVFFHGAHMRRREFIGLVGGAAATSSIRAFAPQPERLQRIDVTDTLPAPARPLSSMARRRRMMQH
jgi:hypothetical protein